MVKPNEWGALDRKLAPKLLEQRGYDLNSLDIASKKEDYIKELAKPQKESSIMIIAGYILAFFGGLLGLALGWGLNNMRTTLPNGEQVFTYTEKCRKHGSRIFNLAVFMIFVYCLIFIISLLYT